MHRKIRTFLNLLFATFLAGLVQSQAGSAETVNFGTDWKAEAEHGGYYQALATGIYKKHGLDVNLRPGGPQVNHAQLLAAGATESSPVTEVGGGIRVATVLDPFGNVFGVIENPHFKGGR